MTGKPGDVDIDLPELAGLNFLVSDDHLFHSFKYTGCLPNPLEIGQLRGDSIGSGVYLILLDLLFSCEFFNKLIDTSGDIQLRSAFDTFQSG